MEVYEKLTKQISETKYLSTENSYRYRPIMRCFYNHYERLEYWLYKEDVFNELKDNEIFTNYTLEDIGLFVNDELMVNYDFKSDWEFILKNTGKISQKVAQELAYKEYDKLYKSDFDKFINESRLLEIVGDDNGN